MNQQQLHEPGTRSEYAASRRRFLRDATFVSLGLYAAACQLGPTPTGKKGGEFHAAWPYELPPKGHFNYYETGAILGDAGFYLGSLFLPTLASYRWADAKWEYWLAESHTISSEGIEVKLRSGVKWDDGKPFTSKDVWTTFMVGRVESYSAWRFIDRVDTPDERTARFRFSRPASLAERSVLRVNIYPDAVYGEMAKRAQQLYDAGKTNQSDEVKALLKEVDAMRPAAPFASGPYRLDPASVTEAQLTLVRNPGGLFADQVKFDRVVVYQGETAQVTPLVLSGDVDFATHGFPVATDKAFQEQGLRILRGPLYTGPALYFHWENASQFQDKRLRWAVAHVINRAESGRIAYGESARAPKFNAGFSDSLVPNWISAEEQKKLKAYEYDVAKAEALLKEAGYAKGGDGVWAKDGKRLEFEFYFPSDFADWSSAATHAADALNKFGIKITLRGAARSQQGPDFNNGKFQISMNPWGIGNPHPQASLVRPFRDFNTTPSGGGHKYPLKQQTSSGAVDFDALLDDAGAGFDVSKQKEAVTKIGLAFNDLLPVVPLWERLANFPVNSKKRVTGWPSEGDPLFQNGTLDLFVTILIMNGTLGSL